MILSRFAASYCETAVEAWVAMRGSVSVAIPERKVNLGSYRRGISLKDKIIGGFQCVHT